MCRLDLALCECWATALDHLRRFFAPESSRPIMKPAAYVHRRSAGGASAHIHRSKVRSGDGKLLMNLRPSRPVYMSMQRMLRSLRSWAIGYVLFSVAGGITLAELQLHPWRRPLTHVDEAQRFVHAHYGATLENVEMVAKDGVTL